MKLKRLGRMVHVTKSGMILVRADFAPRLHSDAFNEKLGKLGIIVDVFGPVDNPYVLIKPASDELVKMIRREEGMEVYVTMTFKR